MFALPQKADIHQRERHVTPLNCHVLFTFKNGHGYGTLAVQFGLPAEALGAAVQPWRSMTSTVTGARPEKPNARAAAGITSMIRPGTNGPRSLIRTTTERPLSKCVMRTSVPNGRVL